MKNKTSILTVLILFVLSTTGFPVFSHYCLVQGESVNLECIDSVENQLLISACCVEEIDEINDKSEVGKTNCCIDNFDYKKIEDNFFQTITTNLFPIFSVISEENLFSVDLQSENKFSEQTKHNLPPPKFGKELLYTIHQLKVDLPIC